MSAAPRVSVVMPVWNADPRQLEVAVQSVLAQSLREIEVIVVEDASERPAAAVLERLADPRIRHVLVPERGSMAAARNRGLALARSELVAMFDGDDVSEVDRLARQADFLERHPGVAVLGTALTVIDTAGTVRGRRGYPVDHEAIVRAMRSYNPLAHPTVMARKQALLAAGGYCEDPRVVCDDYDLWSRLARRGVRFANLPEPLVRYRLHDGATKSRRLKATLRDTLRIKRDYWRGSLTLRDRARMLGERVLLLMPRRLVMALFVRVSLDSP